MAAEQKDGGDVVENLTGSNGFLLEPRRVWTLCVEIGSSGSPEMQRSIRPENSIMRAFYGHMFYPTTAASAMCMFPGCYTTHSMPAGSFTNPMKHIRRMHPFLLASNDLIAKNQDTDIAEETKKVNPFSITSSNAKKVTDTKTLPGEPRD